MRFNPLNLFPFGFWLLAGCLISPYPQPPQHSAPLTADDSLVMPWLSRFMPVRGDSHRTHAWAARARAGDSVIIGFLGGSITAGASASQPRLSYASLFMQELHTHFPRARFGMLNAGIGATDSRYACSRARFDLLNRSPDLIVVDFGVNDTRMDSSQAVRAYEGLLRQALSDTNAAVWGIDFLLRDGETRTRDRQHAIAHHYGVPVIGYADAVWPWIAEDTSRWGFIARDLVHPSDLGHAIASTLLAHALDTLMDQIPLASVGQGLPLPLHDSSRQFSTGFGASGVLLQIVALGAWSQRYGTPFSQFESNDANDTLIVSGSFREATVLYRYAADRHAVAQCQVDSATPYRLDAHFADDWGGGYMKPMTLIDADSTRMHRILCVNLSGGSFLLEKILVTP